MMRRIPMHTWTAVPAAMVLLLAACGDDADPDPVEVGDAADDSAEDDAAAPDDTAADEGPDDAAADEAPEEEAVPDDDPGTDVEEAGETVGTLDVADTDVGEVLVDGDGMTLYLFDPDDQGESTCFDGCAEAWPPVEGPVEAGEGVDAALIGTVERDDGPLQATYDGWPLYRYAADDAPGDATGQGVQDVWWVVSAAGDRITDADADAGDEAEPAAGTSRDY